MRNKVRKRVRTKKTGRIQHEYKTQELAEVETPPDEPEKK